MCFVSHSLECLAAKSITKPRLSEILTDAALRIGATQILFMDVDVYAAVFETVESLRMHPKINVSYVLKSVLGVSLPRKMVCSDFLVPPRLTEKRKSVLSMPS